MRVKLFTLSRRPRSMNPSAVGSHFVLEQGSELVGACSGHAGLRPKSSS